MKMRPPLLAALTIAVMLSGTITGQSLPSPEETFGFRMGADRRLIDYNQIFNYFMMLDQESDRIAVQELGKTTLPMALLVGGAQIGNIHSSGLRWWRQIGGLTITRLIVCPLILWGVFALIGWQDLQANIVIIMAAMPVGLTSAIFAKNYGADAEFAALATFWSTLAVTVTLPAVVFLLV